MAHSRDSTPGGEPTGGGERRGRGGEERERGERAKRRRRGGRERRSEALGGIREEEKEETKLCPRALWAPLGAPLVWDGMPRGRHSMGTKGPNPALDGEPAQPTAVDREFAM